MRSVSTSTPPAGVKVPWHGAKVKTVAVATYTTKASQKVCLRGPILAHGKRLTRHTRLWRRAYGLQVFHMLVLRKPSMRVCVRAAARATDSASEVGPHLILHGPNPDICTKVLDSACVDCEVVRAPHDA